MWFLSTFGQKYNLKTQIESVHEEQVLDCDIYLTSFTREVCFNRHSVSAHKGKSSKHTSDAPR